MAKETIVINKRSYKAKELDFNFLCELGEAGIDIQDIDKKMLPTVRVYVAYCMGVDAELAGEEINRHVINGGTFDDFTSVFSEKAESSDFFRALGQMGQKATETSSKKSTKKKTTDEQTEVLE